MKDLIQLQDSINRRTFLQKSAGLGLTALFTMLGADGLARVIDDKDRKRAGGLPGIPHFKPKAKRVIYLLQSGAPSHLDLFDYKPKLADHRGEDLPDSIRMGQRLTGMTSAQAKFPVAPTIFKFNQHGQSGIMLTELMPHIGNIVDAAGPVIASTRKTAAG